MLVLHPDPELFGDIVHQNLSDALDDNDNVSYTALSYARGSSRVTRTIYLGHRRRELQVGRNLYDALSDIRRDGRPIRIWADAICINQKDLVERNQQVQLMPDIFSSAKETIVYLGHDLCGNTGISAWNFLESKSTWATYSQGNIDATIPDRMKELDAFQGDIADVEIDVLGRPWFRRVWVFQEVIVSRRISLQCSRRRIPWDEFCKAVLPHQRYHDRYGQSLYYYHRAEIIHHMFHARRAYLKRRGLQHRFLSEWHVQVKRHDSESSYILDTLERARRLGASDPRDKVFALGI